MTCDRWNDDFVAFLYDDELSPTERETIAEHLVDCADCRERMDGLRDARRFLSSAPEPQHRAAPRVIVLQPKTSRSNRWPGWAQAAAAAAVFAVGIWLGVGRTGGEVTILDPGMEGIPTTAQNQGYDDLIQRVSALENRVPVDHNGWATQGHLQNAVGQINRQMDERRAQDLQWILETIVAADQEALQRDRRTLQYLEVMHKRQQPR